jgi:hypothetical protein
MPPLAVLDVAAVVKTFSGLAIGCTMKMSCSWIYEPSNGWIMLDNVG